jgi:hypothetical protein
MDIAAAVKAQMLGVLLDAIARPVTVGGNAVPAAPPASTALVAGETVAATVTAIRPDGRLVIAIKGQTVQAEIRGADLPASARGPGAVLQLTVETTGATPRLAFAGVAQSDAQVGTAQVTKAPVQPPSVGTPDVPTVRIAQPAAPPEPVVAPAVNQQAAVVARAATDAAVRQGSAAPLYADLAALVNRSAPALPPVITALAQAILANRLDGDAPVTAKTLKQAIDASGVLQESHAADGKPAPLDAKALLTTLRDLLRRDAPQFSPPHPTDAEPPRRDGAVTAQRAAVSQLATTTEPATIAAALAREADQAVERLTLHQIASLPEQRTGITDNPKPQQLNFELPIAFGQQTTMAGFRIEREKRRAKDSGQTTDIWGVRFAIDADVLGSVHAHVRLAGQRISVTLWAEEAATHSAFVAAIPMLQAALTGNALEIGDLAVFPGRPAEKRRAASGHFLDRRS